MDKIDSKIDDFIKKNALFSDCNGAVIAVSGGSDSMTLLNYMIENREKLGFPFAVAHIDHSLRPESSDEADFVRKYCEKNGVAFELLKADIAADKPNGLTCEEYARNVRYDFFNKIRVKYGYSHIVTAHNKNDFTETFFLNLIRGMGSNGACGIPAKRSDGVVRPLLSCEKNDIIAHCKEKNIPYVTDKSNFENIYTRNILRNDILPLLKELNPSLDSAVGRFSRSITDDSDFLEKYSENLLHEYEQKHEENRQKNEIPLNFLRGLEKPIKSRVLRRCFFDVCAGAVLTYKQTDDIMKLIDNGCTSDKIQLSGGMYAVLGYDTLIFKKNDSAESFSVIADEGITQFGELSLEIKKVEYDGTKSKNRFKSDLPVRFRSRKSGDRIKFPKRPEKSVKELFIDEKIPAEKRNMIPIAVDGNDKPIWIYGFGADENHLPIPNGHNIEVKIKEGIEKNG